MSAPGRARPRWTLSALPAVLLLAGLLAGCGNSSGGATQTSTSTAKSAQQTTSSTSGTSTGASTAPRPSVFSSGAAEVVTGSSGGVTATLHAGTHHPRVGRPWPIRFTVTGSGRAARASVSYVYLFGGQVVARRSHYTFTGNFSDVFRWPASAVGFQLTFRAAVVSGGVTINLDYPVQVVALG